MKFVEPRFLNGKFSRFPTPSAAILELTNRCNEQCIHCIRESPTLRFNDELSTEEWLAIIDDLARIQTFSLCLTGGECTIHPGFFKIIERAQTHRINVSIKTNALNLRKIAADLKKAGVGLLEVSLYGATAPIHDQCTRIKGSFDLLVEGVQAAKKEGLAVVLNCVLFRWNVHELLAMRALGEFLGCPVKRDYFLTNTDVGRHLDREFITPAQIREVEEVWPGNVLPSNQNVYGTVKICAQGMNTLAVTARGEMLSCVTVRKPLGNVRAGGLAQLWNQMTGGHSGAPKRPHAIDYTKFTRCHDCRYLPRCNVCVGQNYSATGDFYEPPIERCYVTMTLFGQESPEGGQLP